MDGATIKTCSLFNLFSRLVLTIAGLSQLGLPGPPFLSFKKIFTLNFGSKVLHIELSFEHG